MTSLALLLLRLVTGGLLAGHGAQKLFGAFGGGGLQGTTAWLASLQLQPARTWARFAGWSELTGGLLTALGALNPLGAIAGIAAMLMATLKVHLGKPIWVSSGGAELPVVNIAALTAVAIAGPGRFSVDRLLGIRVPWWLTLGALAGAIGGIVAGASDELSTVTSDLGRRTGNLGAVGAAITGADGAGTDANQGAYDAAAMEPAAVGRDGTDDLASAVESPLDADAGGELASDLADVEAGDVAAFRGAEER